MAVEYLGPYKRSAENKAGQRTYVRSFKLRTDDPADGAYQVGSHPNLPIIGDVHPDDPNAYVQRLTVEDTDPPHGWTVTAYYTDERSYLQINPNNNPDNQPGGGGSSPDQDEILISWSSENYEEILTTDVINDEPIKNTAGQFFYVPPTVQRSRFNINVQFNTTQVPQWMLERQDGVNETQVTIGGLAFDARTLLYSNLSIRQRLIRNGVFYYPVSYILKFRRETWDIEILNAGLEELDGDGNLTPIRMPNGEAVTSPWPLDFSGKALADPSDLNAHIYGDFRGYEEFDFTDLPGVSA